MAIQTKQGLEFNISKVTNCKPKVYNLVSKFQYTLNCLVQSYPFPQNLKFENTFLVSRYSYQIRFLLDLVIPNNK